MDIRRFENNDAQEVSELVCRNFIEINSKDYLLSDMERLANAYNFLSK